MRKLLSLVALAGLIGGAFYALAPKAEATPTPIVAVDCADNPYSPDNYSPPPLPSAVFICPGDQILDRVCAALAAGRFHAACVAAAVISETKWSNQCAARTSALALCSTFPDPTVCNAAVEADFVASAAEIETGFWDNVGIAAGIYYAAMAECCGWNETAMLQGQQNQDYNEHHCFDDANPYNNMNHVMPWPWCGWEMHLNMACVEKTQEAFDEAMELADETAADEWEDSCVLMHTDFQNAYQAYHDCLGTGETPHNCGVLQGRLQEAARERRTEREEIIAADHANDLADALATAAASLADCCEDD